MRNDVRLSLYLDEGMDVHIRTLQKAYEEEECFPSGMSRNQFVKMLIGVGAERMTEIVREIQAT